MGRRGAEQRGKATGIVVKPMDTSSTQSEWKLRLYKMMCRIRAFELAAERAFSEGLIVGSLHLCIGQEAVATGVCANLTATDLITSTHRGHGHALAKGVSPVAMMCELFGRTTGVCGGKGGSMHIADFGAGMLGTNGVVPDGLLIAVGAAHALKLQRRAEVVTCFFGDGGANRGPFLEGLNWSCIFELPILFICEDNTFAAMTRTQTMTGGPGPRARAEALGLTTYSVDGNDVLAVDATAGEALHKIRCGQGPQFVIAHTYRLKGHTATDEASYRAIDEVQRWEQEDPLSRSRSVLADLGIDTVELGNIWQAAQLEMEEAYRLARSSPFPSPEQAFADVQDTGSPGRSLRWHMPM